MGDQRISNLAGPIVTHGRLLFRGGLIERLRHVLWAGLISLAMYAVFLFQPIDQFLWLVQSRAADRSPTGDVVFVASDEALNDPDAPEKRYEVAAALDELDRRGVGKVFLDVSFAESGDSDADKRLARAIADLGPRITLVNRIVEGTGVDEFLRTTSPAIGGTAPHVVSDQTDRNWLGFAWELHYAYEVNGKQVRSFGAAIAGVEAKPKATFSVDYGFALDRIPVLPLATLSKSSSEGATIPVEITGKTIVVGHTGREANKPCRARSTQRRAMSISMLGSR